MNNEQKQPVKVWQIAPDGERGAWQYGYENTQGGEDCLKDALYQASFLGKTIMILPDDTKAGINEFPETSENANQVLLSGEDAEIDR